ncbi:MAG: hypothetical protein ACRDRJ_17860 [Streptosporangiaceae bacterium]
MNCRWTPGNAAHGTPSRPAIFPPGREVERLDRSAAWSASLIGASARPVLREFPPPVVGDHGEGVRELGVGCGKSCRLLSVTAEAS